MEGFHQECALACSLQYKDPEDVSVVTHSSNVPMVVFEGTDTVRNWLRNVDCFANKKGVHNGFWSYAIWCIREYNLFEVFRRNEELILTGHSLGAAAAIIVRYIMRHQSTRVRLVLFGCPKVGTQEFREKFARVVNLSAVSFSKQEDPVPCLPFGCCKWGYVQIIDLTYTPFDKRSQYDHSIRAYCDVPLQPISNLNLPIDKSEAREGDDSI